VTDMSLIDKFHRRLKKIGVDVTFIGNYPWIYLDTVNGKRAKGLFQGNHGWTAFFLPARADRPVRFSDRREVFKKIREVLNEKA
jgi:hypothetical protein